MNKVNFYLFFAFMSVVTYSQTQKIISSKRNNLTISNTSRDYNAQKKSVNNVIYEDFSQITKVYTMQKGAPALPMYSTSVELPKKGKVSIEVNYDNYVEYSNINILPSKGSLKRNVNPDLIPYEFGKEYTENTFYPGKLATISDPFILRSTRGVSVTYFPYQYNPVTKKLRIYKNITARVVTTENEEGINEINFNREDSNSDYESVYKNLYLNRKSNTRAVAHPVRDRGEMLVITPSTYTTTIQPFVNWKIEKGIKTTVATLTQTGSTAAAIKTYIQNFYNANPNLAFIMLVGDHENLPSYSYGTTSASESLWSDSYYGQLAGTDLFPEVMVGRFSGSTTNVQTMVTRIVEYETNPATGNWMTKAIGIASNEGAGNGDEGEADNVHMRGLRTKFMGYGYTTVHEFYQGSQGGADAAGEPTPAMVATAINQGVGLINYVGHGDQTSFVTSGFSNTNVNGLTNTGMYPFVISVACNNGTFVGGTALCEEFVRKAHNGTPAGAIAACGSSILMAWAEPMQTQDEMTELIIRSDAQNVRTSLGGLFYNAQVSMLETYAQNDNSKEVMQTWVFFGDPSTEFRSKVTTDITAAHPASIAQNGGNITVTSNTEKATVCISQNNVILATAEINSGTSSLTIPALTSTNALKVTVSKDNKKPYRGTINVTTLGLTDFEHKTFLVYPNPASENINISSATSFDNLNITLFDTNGRTIINKENVSLDANLSLPVTGIASGLYLLEISNNTHKSVFKIQVK